MKKTTKTESKYYRVNVEVSKLVYLEAREFAEKHKVFWSRIYVTKIGDPIDGVVNLEFTAKRSRKDLIERDLEYLRLVESKIKVIQTAGKLHIIQNHKDKVEL